MSRFGYHWSRDVMKSSPCPNLDPDKDFTEQAPGVLESALDLWRTYDPFREEPALFLVFADVEPKKDAILAFANKYGLLGENPYGAAGADGFVQWKRRITAMKHAVRLWQAIQSGNTRRVAQHPWMEVATRKQRGADLLTFATQALDDVIETELNWKVAKLHPVRQNNRLILRTVLNELQDVLWVQFAVAFSESREFRRCKLCGGPYELSPQVNRADRVFCTNTCRVKSYQRRQAKARKMRAAGKKLREIAKELDSDLETVKRWVGEGK